MIWVEHQCFVFANNLLYLLWSNVSGKRRRTRGVFSLCVCSRKGWLDGVSSLRAQRCCCPSPAEWLQPSLATSLHLCFPLDHSRASSADWVLAHQRKSWISEISSHLLEVHEIKSGKSTTTALSTTSRSAAQKRSQESCLQPPLSCNTGNILCTTRLIKILLVDTWSTEN